MAQFSIRIVQQVTEQGSGDFIIEASTAEAAVAVLSTVYKIARAEGSNIVTLQDGQSQILERAEVLDRVVSFMLLDADGEEVRPVSVPLGGSR